MSTEIKKATPVPHSARNVIIGVITTVLVSGTVYLLGFNKKNTGPTKLERQKATTEAWKAYVTVENLYTKTTTLLMRDASQFNSYKEMLKASLKESDKFQNSVKELLLDEDLDKDMIDMFKRRLENEVSSIPKMEKFFMDLDKVTDTAIAGKWTMEQYNSAKLALQAQFAEDIKGMYDRYITDVEDICKTLTDRYKQSFSMDELMIIQAVKYKKDILKLIDDSAKDSLLNARITKENLTGKWEGARGVTIFLNTDNSMRWFIPADTSEASGNWQIKSGQLVINIEKHNKIPGTAAWVFNISNVTDTSFSMQFSTEPYYLLTLVRK